MENAALVTLSRQMALRREIDIIANNVANATTNGFKRRTSELGEFRARLASEDSFRRGEDRRVSFVIDKGTPLDISAGSLEATNNPMDMAIAGDAFFVVNTPQGERYTKNGATQIDSTGQLVNSDGYALQSDQGNVQFTNQERDITFAADGTISSSEGTRGRLRLVRFPNAQVLENTGANVFSASVQPEPATNARVQSGFIERSNVNSVVEISRMIEVSRQYQSIASMLSRSDESRRNAIQKLSEVA